MRLFLFWRIRNWWRVRTTIYQRGGRRWLEFRVLYSKWLRWLDRFSFRFTCCQKAQLTSFKVLLRGCPIWRVGRWSSDRQAFWFWFSGWRRWHFWCWWRFRRVRWFRYWRSWFLIVRVEVFDRCCDRLMTWDVFFRWVWRYWVWRVMF